MRTRNDGKTLTQLTCDRSAKKNVIGVMINVIDYASATDQVILASHQGRGFTVSALAVHGVMTGVLDRTQGYRLNHFDLLVPDGQPVRWALNLLHHAKLSERVYGPTLTLEILKRAERERIPVFFYGSTQKTLSQLRQRIRAAFPEIQIVGAEPSRFGHITPEIADAIAQTIKSSGARIVFVGLGCPRQEVWAFEFRNRLEMPIVAVGAAFPFLAGTLRQAPRWMQDSGLEWLFRLGEEPGRLWRRYLFLNPMYLALVACQRAGLRFRPAGLPPRGEILYG